MVANQIDTLLANYVAGVLPTPVRVLVESHLQLKPGDERRLKRPPKSAHGRDCVRRNVF